MSANSFSTSAEQACRMRPLMTIVQRAADLFQAVGVVGHRRDVLPSIVSACAAIRCNTLVTFMSGSCSSVCRSQ